MSVIVISTLYRHLLFLTLMDNGLTYSRLSSLGLGLLRYFATDADAEEEFVTASLQTNTAIYML